MTSKILIPWVSDLPSMANYRSAFDVAFKFSVDRVWILSFLATT